MEGCIEIYIKLLPQLTNVSMEHKVSLWQFKKFRLNEYSIVLLIKSF